MTDEKQRLECTVLDIDGVLADVRHRLHHLDHRPKDWRGFFAAMADDPPLAAGVELAHAQSALGRAIIYLTGRNESYRRPTERWLREHGLPGGPLVMRPDRDRRPARLFKPEALRTIAAAAEVRLVVDDDTAVVETLRAAGWPVQHATWMPGSRDEQQVLFAAQETEGRT